MSGVLTRHHVKTQRYTQREGGCVMAEVGIRGMQFQASKRPGLPTRVQEDFFPWLFGGSTAVPRPWFGTSTFLTCEDNKLVLRHQAVALSYSSPRNLTQQLEDFGGQKNPNNNDDDNKNIRKTQFSLRKKIYHKDTTSAFRETQERKCS